MPDQIIVDLSNRTSQEQQEIVEAVAGQYTYKKGDIPMNSLDKATAVILQWCYDVTDKARRKKALRGAQPISRE